MVCCAAVIARAQRSREIGARGLQALLSTNECRNCSADNALLYSCSNSDTHQGPTTKVPIVVSAPSPPPAKTLETLQVRLFEERLPAPTMLSP